MGNIDIPITDKLVIFTIANVMFWIVSLAIVKTDLRWIKKRMCDGDIRMNVQGERLNVHAQEIAAIKSICRFQHGVDFPKIPNGKGDQL